ncbi:MAG: porin [endosymbiont of Galathealinum brachiosum]|uniref:Porin n=1 Tax=endosymbiont of Galathealinum brachiosum TaxID=2200906 RepID=A0A370DFL5_9GAMM|nr:MAG: porin [endosymbiont of Galathealinum brachiosum]
MFKENLMNIKKLSLLAGLTLLSTQTYAANWLSLQGTEKPGSSARAKLWGFVQPEYQSTDGGELKAGPFAGQIMSPNVIRPDNTSTETFNIRRARIGVRGTGFPLDDKVNYFLLAELGHNGITKNGKTAVALTDASITLNHIPGARVRVGQFKTPTSEEGLQAIHVFNYVNFTNITNQMMLERYTDGDGSEVNGQPEFLADGVTPNPKFKTGGTFNGINGSVGAFRDQGIQVFDTFKVNDWEHSYAVMYGNGNGINRSDNNDAKDTYLYWSSELIFGGKGARRQGMKLFAWNQSGTRTLTTSDANGKGEYDRDRSGLGVTFLKDKYRFGAEYMTADGMIFNGSDAGAIPGSTNNAGDAKSDINVLTEDKSDGYYVDFGYKVLPKLELDVRYDVLNRATETAAGERKFDTLTLGAQYFLNKKSRITFNYEIRNQEAPDFASTAAPNQIADSLDDLLSLQLLVIF